MEKCRVCDCLLTNNNNTLADGLCDDCFEDEGDFEDEDKDEEEDEE